jgi:glucokinase
MIVLAGDIGGTNSRLALYENGRSLFEHTYPSAEFPSLEAVLLRFLDEAATALGRTARPERACLAVAGPVEDGRARITNLSWVVDARPLAAAARLSAVRLVNDFEAAACGVPLLRAEDLLVVGGGPPEPRGPVVVTGPGTGLGQAFLSWSDVAARYEVIPSEGGHSDFAAITPLEHGIAQALAARHGHVSYERLASGPGLRELFALLAEEPAARGLVADETRQAMETEDGAAVIGRQAVAGRDPICLLAVNLFLSVVGAHAGNLALTVLATGGVFIAGGIVPRLEPLLARSPLRASFEAKGRLQPVLQRIPLYVVTNRELGLIGAAALASRR